MKKLLTASLLSLVLAACSSNDAANGNKPMTPEMEKEAFTAAFKTCEAKLGGKVTRKDIPAFDACMAQNGFERVAKEDVKPAPSKKQKNKK